jgi:hypothetical protein
MSKAEDLAGLLDANGDVLATNLDNVSVAFADVTSKPTTLAGYGITDAASDTELTNAVANSANWDTAYGWGNHASAGYATTTYVDGEVANLVAAAPATLDTLNELAAALGDDANFSTTVTNSLAAKAPLASPALTGTPTAPTAAADTNTTQIATTAYVQTELGDYATLASPTFTTGISVTGSSTVDDILLTAVALPAAGNPSIALRNTDNTVYMQSGSSNSIKFIDSSQNAMYTMSDTQHSFNISNVEKFRMESDGDFHADGDVIAYSTSVSDKRLKTNIQGIENAVAKVSQLNGYTFEYKADGKVSAGVIAQEVETVLPEAVSEKQLPLKTDDDQEYKVVNYDALHGLLIEAVKELAARVEALEAK